MMKMIASPELRKLMMQAGHIPGSARVGYGVAEATGTVNGHSVRIVGSMVERCTLDGWVYVLMLRSFIGGKQVSRARLFQLCGVPA